MNKSELQDKYTEKEFIDKFTELFSLKLFLNQCIISEDYEFNGININSIELSSHGQELFDRVKTGRYSDIDENYIKLAIFLDFYNSELLIDIEKCDSKALLDSISKEVVNGNIKFPWIYGRTLYDKYYDEFEEQDSKLENDNVLKLLKDTPKGVFQLGNLVIGPLGILESNFKRVLPPTRSIGLWHCPDPGCGALHKVKLFSARTIITELLNEISDLTIDITDSEWYSFYMEQIKDTDIYYDDNRVNEVPITLVYSFGENELRLVLKEIIDEKPEVREILPNLEKFKGASDKIIKSLTKAECFQIILLFDSLDVLTFTEKLISEKNIYIPSTEIRVSKLQLSGGYFNIYHECNKLGFRSVASDSHMSFVRLRNLILDIYEEPHLQQQLEWSLRFYKKDSLIEQVEEYINSQEPRKIIREVVLNGPLQVNKTFQSLNGYFNMPSTFEEEEKIIDKILWKLGFSINIYPSILSTFEERLAKFSKIVSEKNSYKESDKENIRSAAVNLFVSLEEVLKHALAFSTWLLLNDHLKITRFKYNYADATEFMTNHLNGYKLNEETELVFDVKGRNTLYPLIEGFTALFGKCDAILDEDKEQYKRDESELPAFIGKTKLVTFPLLHKLFIHDIKTSSYLNIRELGLKIPSEFSKYKILGVRNSLEHDREEFPSKEELINACNCMRTSVEELKYSGLYPNVYLFQSLQKDKYNRLYKTFEDYNGNQVTIPEIISYKGYPVPNSYSPIIILPTINFPESSEPLRIKYEENSEYLFYWKGYPRKKNRKIDKNKEQTTE